MRTKDLQRTFDLSLVFILSPTPRVVRSPHSPRKRAAKHQRRRSLGIGRCEQERHRRSFRKTVEGGAARADGIHHRPYIVHASFQSGRTAHPVGHPRTALVEPNQPRKRSELIENRREARHLPMKLEMGDIPRDEDEIERPFAADLIRDVEVAALRVMGYRTLHENTVSASATGCATAVSRHRRRRGT